MMSWSLWEGASLASPFDPRGTDWEGFSEFVALAQSELGPQRVVTPAKLDLRDLKREDGLFLVHPERALDVYELSSFMRAGGRIVLLDDYGTGDELLAHYGIRRVPLPGRPSEMLRGNPSLAIAKPASAHSVVRDVPWIVTNHGTGVEQSGLSPLLVVHGEGEPDVLIALAGSVSEGRLAVVGDASVSMNAMLRYPGNRAFSRALMRYATEDDAWGPRGGRLYVLINDFQLTGSFDPLGAARGNESPAAKVAGEARRAAIDVLDTLRRDGMPPLASYLVALGLGLGVIVWTSAQAGKAHRPRPPRFVRPVRTVAQGGVAGHAAVLGAPGTSRVLALLELKSALEEELATRLGLDRAPPHDQLIAKLRGAGLLDAERLHTLSTLLAYLTRIETMLVQRRRATERVRDSDVARVAARVRDVLDASAAASLRATRTDRLGHPV